MRRDRMTFAMMLGVPLIQLVLFGFAINNDPKSLPTALVSIGSDRYSRAVIASMESTGYFRFTQVVASAAEAETLLNTGAVAFVVTIPADFGTRVERKDNPHILVEADATDPSASSGALSALSDVSQGALRRELRAERSTGPPRAGDFEVIIHRRFNPEMVSQYNTVPGLLGVILQMTMVMMTSMALTRETENGTMENLLAMPTTPMEIMFGKILPYLGVGAVQVVVILASAKLLFAVPFVGGVTLLFSGILIFVLALVLLGYAISTVSRTQMQAMQLTFFYFLPSILLSGFMFPFRGMPVWAQYLGETFPLTHFLRLTRGVMLKGGDWTAVQFEFWVLVGFGLLYASIALLRFHDTLD